MKISHGLVSLILCVLSTGLVAADSAKPTIDPKAAKVIRRMCDYVQSLKSFEGRHQTYISNWAGASPSKWLQFAVLKPNKLALVPDGTNTSSLVCDGTNLHDYQPGFHQLDYVMPAPANLDAITNSKPGILLKILLSTNRHELIMGGFVAGMKSLRYVNREMTEGVQCDHLQMEQKQTAGRAEDGPVTVDMWITAGNSPVIVKLSVQLNGVAINFTTGEAREKQVQSMIEVVKDWKANGPIANERFAFTPPKGSTRVNPGDKTIVIKEPDGTVITIDRATGSAEVEGPIIELKPKKPGND
jgi:hypothetical protein